MKSKKKIYLALFAQIFIPNITLGLYIFWYRSTWLIEIAVILSLGLAVASLILCKNTLKISQSIEKELSFSPIENQLLFEMKKTISQLVSSLTPFSGNISKLTDVSSDILKGANIQSENVEKSMSAIINMSSGIQQIAVSATKVSDMSKTTSEEATEGFKLIETVIGQMASIHQKVDHLSEVIMDLSNYSNEIGQIVNTITEIARNTNLLALNAAIEAARAGEHGKGFAVVADEVRKLSEEATNSAKKIIDIVSSIQDKVTKSVELTNDEKLEVENGIGIVNNVKRSFKVIQQEINSVSQQILDVSAAVQELSAGSEEISDVTEYTKKVQIGGVAKISNLTELTDQLVEDISEILSNTKSLTDNLLKN